MPHYLIIPGSKVNGSAEELSRLGFNVKEAFLVAMLPEIEMSDGVCLPGNLITVNLKSINQKGELLSVGTIYVSLEECKLKRDHLQRLGFELGEIYVKQLHGSFEASEALWRNLLSGMGHKPEEFAITYLSVVEV